MFVGTFIWHDDDYSKRCESSTTEFKDRSRRKVLKYAGQWLVDNSNGYDFEEDDEYDLLDGKEETVYRIYDILSVAEYIPCRLEMNIREVKRKKLSS
jgi:hypothetical protein